MTNENPNGEVDRRSVLVGLSSIVVPGSLAFNSNAYAQSFIPWSKEYEVEFVKPNQNSVDKPNESKTATVFREKIKLKSQELKLKYGIDVFFAENGEYERILVKKNSLVIRTILVKPLQNLDARLFALEDLKTQLDSFPNLTKNSFLTQIILGNYIETHESSDPNLKFTNVFAHSREGFAVANSSLMILRVYDQKSKIRDQASFPLSTFFHELIHLFASKIKENDWMKLNFGAEPYYGVETGIEKMRKPERDPKTKLFRKWGFVTYYGQSNYLEDIATVGEVLFGYHDLRALKIFEDPVLVKKLNFLAQHLYDKLGIPIVHWRNKLTNKYNLSENEIRQMFKN